MVKKFLAKIFGRKERAESVQKKAWIAEQEVLLEAVLKIEDTTYYRKDVVHQLMINYVVDQAKNGYIAIHPAYIHLFQEKPLPK